MKGAAAVRRYILNAAGSLIARRELMVLCGSRGVVTNELARLIAKGIIRRVAVGVYSVVARSVEVEGAFEIATVRCRAFGKRILSGVNDGFKARCKGQTTVITDGCRTSFKSIHGRIFLKASSPRRLKPGRRTQSNIAAATVKLPRTRSHEMSEPAKAAEIMGNRSIWSQKLICLFGRAIRNMCRTPASRPTAAVAPEPAPALGFC